MENFCPDCGTLMVPEVDGKDTKAKSCPDCGKTVYEEDSS